jgi:2-polyprenyl-6-methoxyphenol hydroxylase-like FAD-dependent oxidoreductase
MIAADVLIIGRGIAGCAMALALKKKGVKNIVLVGREPGFDENITETLPIAGHQLLCRLDLGHLVEKHPVSNGIVSRWGGNQTLVRESVFEVFDASWQLNKTGFARDLHDAVINQDIPCITIYQLQDTKRGDEGKWQLRFKQGETEHFIHASFVVDASGRNSVFARKAGGKKILFDNQVAITGVFASQDRPAQKISSFIEALPNGWCYSAVNHKNARFVTLFTDADILTDLKLNKKAAWLEYMQHSGLFNTMAACEKLADISVCPASSYFMEIAEADNWLSIGDVCYAVDPLTSAGLFHALHSAITSADHLSSYQNGDENALARLASINRNRFENYLQERVTMYRQVTAFANNQYWQRRHGRILLSPNQLIGRQNDADATNQLKKISTHLSPLEWESLYALCGERTAAHEIVSKFNTFRPAIPPERAIQALQFLIERELLRRVGE